MTSTASTGSSTVNVEPAPGSLSTAMPPPRSVTKPCGSTSRPLASKASAGPAAWWARLYAALDGAEREELAALIELCVARDVRPLIDSTYHFTAVADAFAHLASGAVFGKVAVDLR